MVSLGHLAMDVNIRKNRQEEGYKDVEIYIEKLPNTSDGVEQLLPGGYGKSNQLVSVSGKKYYNLSKYLSKVFDELDDGDEERNKFKQMYFECVKVELDSNTSRVWRMFFKNIKQI